MARREADRKNTLTILSTYDQTGHSLMAVAGESFAGFISAAA
jgi:hypothetical protein